MKFIDVLFLNKNIHFTCKIWPVFLKYILLFIYKKKTHLEFSNQHLHRYTDAYTDFVYGFVYCVFSEVTQ